MRSGAARRRDRERGGSVVRAAKVESGSDARERILRAALAAFAERGFDGAKTREIAARADVTLGLLQYYFGSKPKLWQAAVDLAFGELRSGLDAVLADPRPTDVRELLRLMIRSHVRFAARNPEFVRLMHDEGKRRGPRMRWLVDRHVKPVYEKLIPVVLRSQEQGVLPAGIAPVHLLYILVGSVDVIFHQSEECKRVAGIDPTDDAAVEAHARAVETLFLGPPNEESSR
jgi:AcrR family transcriptional regulator